MGEIIRMCKEFLLPLKSGVRTAPETYQIGSIFSRIDSNNDNF